MGAPRSQADRAPLFLVSAIVAAVALFWALARPASELQQTRSRFAALQREVAAAQRTKDARAAERGRVLRLRAQARIATGDQRATYEAEAAAIDARLAQGTPAELRAAVRGAPLLGVRRAVPAPTGLVPVSAANSDGCVGCHQAIASPGFEAYPAPFRPHPALKASVGADSPHPPSRVRCTSCHLGDGAAESFARAGHARLPDAAAAASVTAASTARATATAAARAARHTWLDVDAAGAMLPVGRTEGGCVSCHAGERHQPGAPALNDALATLERGGCYACHDLPGVDPGVKRGPSLRRLTAKLQPDWVRRWLANPRAVKPATWMPAFWDDPSAADAQAEVDAVTAYLFAASEDYTPAAAGRAGDPDIGRGLVESVGCLGCHVTGEAPRDGTSPRRTFGQPLQAVGSKTTAAWLADWLREPSRYSPGTRMPSLRLTPEEAGHIAAFLGTLTEPAAQATPRPQVDDAAIRAVLARHSGQGAPPDDQRTLSGERLRVEAGRRVIEARGCFNCHDIPGFDGRRTTAPIEARRVWRGEQVVRAHGSAAGPQAGPAAARPSVGAFALGATEAERLALALTSVAGPVRDTHAMSMPWHLAKVAGRMFVEQRNCVGCHPVDGGGGDLVQLVAEPSLGPPLLTPEGARVRPEWLRQFLKAPGTIRPWLSVRMPTFGLSDEEIEVAGSYFRAIAPPAPESSGEAPSAPAAAARELFELLKCQQCHVLGTVPRDQPTSNLAPDLRMAHQRLQPAWIVDWLRNPGAILPGTRMPSFWPDYPRSFYPPLGRDGAAQVRAVRDHVMGLR